MNGPERAPLVTRDEALESLILSRDVQAAKAELMYKNGNALEAVHADEAADTFQVAINAMRFWMEHTK